MDEQEKRGQQKALGNVTRLEFYIGIALVLLFVVILSLAMERAAERRAWDMVQQLDDRATQTELAMSGLAGEMTNYVLQMAEEMESPFLLQDIKVIGVNHKAGTMRVEVKARLKEFFNDIKGMFFIYGDGTEKFSVPGILDENWILRAEAELPLCETLYVTAGLRIGGRERLEEIGTLEITESMTTPEFEGRWKEFSHDTQDGKDILTGVMEAEAIFPSEWADENTALRDCTLEIEKNGQIIQTVPMEGSVRDTSVFYENAKYYGRIQEPVLLEEGCEIAFWFRAVDINGASYTCLLQKGTLDSKTGRYTLQKGTEGADESGESLIIE